MGAHIRALEEARSSLRARWWRSSSSRAAASDATAEILHASAPLHQMSIKRLSNVYQTSIKRLSTSIKRLSNVYQMLIKGQSRVNQGSIKGQSRVNQGSIKGQSRVNQGSIKGQSRVNHLTLTASTSAWLRFVASATVRKSPPRASTCASLNFSLKD
jgi:hypothetical protein